MEQIDIDRLSNSAMDLVMTYGPKLVYAIFTLLIGLWIIKIFMNGVGTQLISVNGASG